MENISVSLQSARQRLQVMPSLGGSVTAWDWKIDDQWSPLFRPWDGRSGDRYTFACYPLVPWSNRITNGGFEQDGIFYPIRQNRHDEAYPIHGDGWLQPWNIAEHTEDRISLILESHCFNGNPYYYVSTETFTLLPHGLSIELTVTNLGDRALPYGLGIHPIFMRGERAQLQFKASGVWLADAESIPVAHTTNFPPTWNYNMPAPFKGELIDNCFTGWDGKSRIEYPDRGITITMTMADTDGYVLMYRPPEKPYFALEPVTHPIDAFHMQGMPGLVLLAQGQKLGLQAELLVEKRGGS